MDYPRSGMASLAAPARIHHLTRWLLAVLLAFFGVESLHGLDQIYAIPAAGGTALVWLKAIGLWPVRGTLLVLAAVLLASVAGGLAQNASSVWTRWWTGVPVVLMLGISWTLWGPWAGARWMPVLSIALSLLLFWLAVGLTTCTGGGRCFGAAKEDFQRPGIFAVGVMSTCFLFAHVLFGTGNEESLFGFFPHLVGLLASAPSVIWLVAMVLHRHPEVRSLTRPAVALVCLLPVEILLGIWNYLLSVRQPAEMWLPFQTNIVFAGELHLLGGGVLGALSLLVTLRARMQLTARVIASPLKRGAVEA